MALKKLCPKCNKIIDQAKSIAMNVNRYMKRAISKGIKNIRRIELINGNKAFTLVITGREQSI